MSLSNLVHEAAVWSVVGAPILTTTATAVTAHRYGVGMSYWRAESPEIKANVRRAARIRRNWERQARNLGLFLEDRHPTLAQRWDGQNRAKTSQAKITVPKLTRATADEWGATFWFRTLDTVGFDEFEAKAKKLATAWQVREVQVNETDAPEIVRVRALVTNPLTKTVEMEVPAAPITEFGRVPLGFDGWGDGVSMPIKDGSGAVVGGNPGYGKTAFLLYLITILAPSDAVQFIVANGKAPAADIGDYRGVAPRISHLLGDDPKEVLAMLKGLQKEMKRRYLVMWGELGADAFWESELTPSVAWPVIVCYLDECQTWMQDPAIKEIAQDIMAKCRGAGIFLVLATQKPTDNNLPTSIRDLATTSISFPVRVSTAAVAALGEDIREFPSMSPQRKMRPEFRGVGTVINETSAGFTQFKSPFCSRTLAARVATATAHYARDIPGITVGCGHRRTTVPDTPAQAVELGKLRVVKDDGPDQPRARKRPGA